MPKQVAGPDRQKFGSKSLLAIVLALTSLAAHAEPSSAISRADRAAILDLLRDSLQRRVGPKVEFIVTDLRGRDGWAFVQAEPQRPGGRPIDGRTFFPSEWEYMDGLTTTALLQKRAARWRILKMKIGATDAWYCGHALRQQFDPCRR
jgi:hypothetical protein